MSRTPKPDVQPAPATSDAAPDQLWSVDSDGRAILVAQGSTSELDAAWIAGIEGGAAAEAASHAYDGHVPLVLDAQELASFDATFDFLTNSPDLFDVPVLDSPAAADDASGA